MNFLFHMYLSGTDAEILVGNFMGDFVKGPLDGRFTHRVRQGVELHRRIDSFAEGHPAFRSSRSRIASRYGRFRGIMVDMFYDHLLLNDWDKWSAEPWTCFTRRCRVTVQSHKAIIPQAMQPLLPVIFDDLIPSYASVSGIGSALGRLSRRIGRQNPLAGGEIELARLHPDLLVDFRSFALDITSYAEELRECYSYSERTFARGDA